MAMALILGLMLGFGFALLHDWLDYRLRSAEEISAILGIPVLGVVPTMSEERTIVTHSRGVWLELKAIVTKACRKIRTAVFSAIAEGKAKVTAVASLASGADKTKSERQAIIRQTIIARAKAHRKMRTAVFPNGIIKRVAVVTSPAIKDDKVTLREQMIIAHGQKVRLEPKSIVAEAYRTIRTAVFFGIPKGEAKTILVTSPAPSDGKSTLVSNLAITMAQAGQKTLVLDADFRKPVQHKIFEIDREKGISGVIAGTHTLDEAIQPGSVEGLDILSCGPEVPNPSEILNSNLFAGMLRGLSEGYDRVIIDSPPVTSVTDGQILGAICDVTLLVLRAEKSTRRLSQQARDSLLSVGAHILGAVVNDVSRKHGRYGYYSGYSYYSGYGYYGYYGDREKKKEYEQSIYV